MNRSDLFTDEEIVEVERLQKQIIIDSIKERKVSNINSINEMANQFIGVSGKENILKKLKECPEDIVTEEVKNAVLEAIDNGCILKTSENGKTTKKTKRSADAICLLLDYAAIKISKWGNEEVSQEVERNDPVYKFCNSGTYYTAHIFTLAFAQGELWGRM